MTSSSSGRLEASAQERVDLWTNAEEAFLHSPIVGNGYATFQLEEHVGDLRDTHNWYVKVLVETGILGLIPVLFMLQQMLSTSYRLLKRATDPLYRGLGLGLFVAICACLVANCFGDRWTYLEITGLLWILVAAAIRATQFTLASPELAPVEDGLSAQVKTSAPVFATARKTNPWHQPQTRPNPASPLKQRHFLEDKKL
jgi:O-antigen ligase